MSKMGEIWNEPARLWFSHESVGDDVQSPVIERGTADIIKVSLRRNGSDALPLDLKRGGIVIVALIRDLAFRGEAIRRRRRILPGSSKR